MGNERISSIPNAGARASAGAVDATRASSRQSPRHRAPTQPPHGAVGRDTPPAPALLLVESDPDKQWRLARTLTVHGYRVVGTVSGEGALALMSEWRVDLVLISSRIRDEDGLEVAARLCAAHPRVPIALMADDVTPALKEAAHALGAVAVVARPPAVTELKRLLVEARTLAPLTIPAE